VVFTRKSLAAFARKLTNDAKNLLISMTDAAGTTKIRYTER